MAQRKIQMEREIDENCIIDRKIVSQTASGERWW